MSFSNVVCPCGSPARTRLARYCEDCARRRSLEQKIASNNRVRVGISGERSYVCSDCHENCVMRGRGALPSRCPSCRMEYRRAYQAAYNRASAAKRRADDLLRQYGISAEQYAEILRRQDGRCAICRQTSTKTLAVDHCHETGHIRELLCTACNLVIGCARENPEILMAARDYVERWRDVLVHS